MDNDDAGISQALLKSGRQVKSTRAHLNGKEGHLSGNLIGKRADFLTQTIIAGNPDLKQDEVGVVPRSIAIILTCLTSYNIAYQRNLSEKDGQFNTFEHLHSLSTLFFVFTRALPILTITVSNIEGSKSNILEDKESLSADGVEPSLTLTSLSDITLLHYPTFPPAHEPLIHGESSIDIHDLTCLPYRTIALPPDSSSPQARARLTTKESHV